MGHPNAIETRRIMALEDPLKRLIGVMRGMDKAEVEDYFDKLKGGEGMIFSFFHEFKLLVKLGYRKYREIVRTD